MPHRIKLTNLTRLQLLAMKNGLRATAAKSRPQWEIPKIWQILDEAPEVYAAADRFVEAADWYLTGKETRNSCTAGYKSMWSKKEGFPPKSF